VLLAFMLATATGCDTVPAVAEIPGGSLTAVEAYVGQLETMAEVLARVVDDDSARAAALDIRRLAREIARIRGRMGQIVASDRDAVASRYGDRIAEASERLRRETMRIGEEPRLVAEVQEALAAVPPLG
jgi:hypothetical protein